MSSKEAVSLALACFVFALSKSTSYMPGKCIATRGSGKSLRTRFSSSSASPYQWKSLYMYMPNKSGLVYEPRRFHSQSVDQLFHSITHFHVGCSLADFGKISCCSFSCSSLPCS